MACSFQDASDETDNPEVDKALGAARVFIADPRRFQLLTIYEGRIYSNMQKNLKQALEEARLHTQLAEMEGVPCDVATDFPDPNGFVFSNAEIAISIRRISRLKAAKRAESSNWAAALHLERPTRRAA